MGQFEAELLERLKSAPGVVAAGIGSRPLGGGGSGQCRSGRRKPRGSRSRSGRRQSGVPGSARRQTGARAFRSGYGFRWCSSRGTRERLGRPRDLGLTRIRSAGQSSWTPPNDCRSLEWSGTSRRVNLELPAAPTIYLSHLQPSSISINNMLVRTSGDPRDVLPAVRAVMRQLDPDQPLTPHRHARGADRRDPRAAPVHAPVDRAVLDPRARARDARGLRRDGGVGRAARARDRDPGRAWRHAGGRPTPRHRAGRLDGRARPRCGDSPARWRCAGRCRRSSSAYPTTDPMAYAIAAACLAAATIAACAIPANRAASMDPVRALRQE